MDRIVPPGSVPLIARAEDHGDRTAVVGEDGALSYRDLVQRSTAAASTLLAGAEDLAEARVAFLVPPSGAYVTAQWGIWLAGGVAVPLSLSDPPAALEQAVTDAGATLLVGHPRTEERLAPIAQRLRIPLHSTSDLASAGPAPLPRLVPERRAMMIFTSGTTSRPKGVVTTHGAIEAQITALVEAWEWNPSDRILGVLPLHHIHGIVNVLACALWAGAACELLPSFDADATWTRVATGDFTLFMGVPTIYVRLITAWERASPQQRRLLSDAARRLRLMVSGSAALPVPVLQRWQGVTGHVLLERYGMTETGMVLSNPLRGERRPGFVGTPLPRVELRLVDEEGKDLPPGTAGELWVRSPAVFQEYWGNPEATAAAFRPGGWFATGDIALVEGGAYRILGRSSIDIIKTGGYKVSALEVEAALLEHPAVTECAVVGTPDPEWGERVCAAIVLRSAHALELPALRAWASHRLAPYKLPTRLLCLDALPRNAMGKVVKPGLAERFHA